MTASEKETTTTRLPKGTIITSEGNHNHKSKKGNNMHVSRLRDFFFLLNRRVKASCQLLNQEWDISVGRVSDQNDRHNGWDSSAGRVSDRNDRHNG